MTKAQQKNLLIAAGIIAAILLLKGKGVPANIAPGEPTPGDQLPIDTTQPAGEQDAPYQGEPTPIHYADDPGTLDENTFIKTTPTPLKGEPVKVMTYNGMEVREAQY